MTARRPGPSLAQMRVLVDRAERGPLSAEEARWFRRGLEWRRSWRRDRSAVGLRRALAVLHRPMLRAGVEVCGECSGWDGRRCRGLVTPWPCPTAEAAGLDERREAA
ncbi:hypothetical protein [Streptomyces sp. ME19-01-6]|uniref:hypothetical protein n=1 Tax=Streptomyces sp. ME19-01-6 TaxID=3028686 RepID=UPI0029A5DEFF|nr:hypothetical protein [Streptomyces sp. ME19-01-6]MDX3230567.1 hypothetical protein [Streptomyces sp. ME19-01-6]